MSMALGDDDELDWLPKREHWKQEAACRDLPKDLFYPEAWEDNSGAKAVCASCEVRHDCLVFALETNQRHGIWGGLSERERRGVSRLRRNNG